MKKVNFLTLYLIAIVIFLLGCKNEAPSLPSVENTLAAITVNDGNKDMVGNISDNRITFSDSAVAGTTQVTVKEIRFSDKASANAKTNDMIPLNKTITITAENGSTKSYVISINVSVATMIGKEMTITGTQVSIRGRPVKTITGARLSIASITTTAALLSGSFLKVNNPYITEMGILLTANETLNLELTNTNDVPNGAAKIIATSEQLSLANISELAIIPFSFDVINLSAFTTYYFRGYAVISGGGIVHTDKIDGMTLASKVRVYNFTISLPYNAAAMNLDGSFRMNYYKDISPIRSFGVLITSGNGITLSLNDENAPEGAILITGNATAITAANTSTSGILSLSASNLALGTTYTFRGYVRNDAGITYTSILSRATPVSVTSIPDDNFRNAILSCINTNGTTTLNGQTNATNFGCTESFDGMITANGNYIRTDALVSITEFNYGGQYTYKPAHLKIRSISGVEQMVNLTRLTAQNNSLSSLDVSANTALTYLGVDNNSLSSLDVSANTALTYLGVVNNSLSSLDVSANTALNRLYVESNSLSSLDVSANTALTRLGVQNNSLSSLSVSTNTALTHLGVQYNSLSSLDVSANTALIILGVYNNSLSSLGISANTNLIILAAYNNSLSSLDVSANTALARLNVDSNSLSSLDVSTNTALIELFASNNALSSLNVTAANTALTTIGVGNNSLTSFVPNNTALTYLSVFNNLLSSLDISTNTALTYLRVFSNSSLTCIRVDASQLAGGSNIILNLNKDVMPIFSESCP